MHCDFRCGAKGYKNRFWRVNKYVIKVRLTKPQYDKIRFLRGYYVGLTVLAVTLITQKPIAVAFILPYTFMMILFKSPKEA